MFCMPYLSRFRASGGSRNRVAAIALRSVAVAGAAPGPAPPAAFLPEGRAFRYGIVGSYGTSLYCASLMFAGVSRMPGGETLRTIFEEWPVSASIAYCTAVTPTL